MNRPALVVFTGLPGTGKTSLSRTIASRLCLPLLAKDDIKEILFDTLGWSNREWSAKLARATFRIMESVVEQQLVAGNTLLVEANYSPRQASTLFQQWQTRYGCQIIQIVCQADIAVLAARIVARSKTNRHPGHLDDSSRDEHLANLKQRISAGEDQPLDVRGTVITVETTDFGTIDIQKLTGQISAFLQP